MGLMSGFGERGTDMIFGDKFKRERKKMKLTQREVADALGISERMISRYEHGDSLPCTKAAYMKIAELFRVDIDYIMPEGSAPISKSEEKYKARAVKQAHDLIDGISGLFAGGMLSEKEKDAVMKELQDIYWKAKERNAEKYTPARYKDE